MSSTTPPVGSFGAGFGRPVVPVPADPAAPAAEGRAPEVGRTGARFGGARAIDAPVHAPVGAAPTDRTFDTVLRGYARDQVDAALRRLDRLVAELNGSVAATTAELRTATRRAEVSESHNRELRMTLAQQAARTEDQGFGVRAERLLRLAESEAADVRSRASRDAADLMGRSRIDAEAYRHEAEQALIARSAELDQSATRRIAELGEREEQAELQLTAARAEAERVTTAAAREADRLHRAAAAAAEQERHRVRVEAEQIREAARLDVDRLAAVRDGAHADIVRVTQLLRAELASGEHRAAGE